jgi:hypothetical protein
MLGPAGPLHPATDRSTARLLAAACSLALLVLSIGAARAWAVTEGPASVSVTFSCTSVTFRFSGFPAGGNSAREIVSVDGGHVAEAEFSFEGPTGENTLSVHVPPGRHSMDARANWKIGEKHREGEDHPLPDGIRCVVEPQLAVEKLQRISGGGESFTAAPVSGWPGEIAEYEIVASNTGNVGLQLTASDARCDPGTLSGGPAGGALAAGAVAVYRCEHVLTAADRRAGTYTNTAGITASWSEEGGGELSRTSGPVVAYVTDPPPPPPPPPPRGEGGTSSSPGWYSGTGAGSGGVLPFGQSSAAPRCLLSLAHRNLRVNSKGKVSLRLVLAGAGTCRGRLALTVKQRTGHGHAKVRTIAARTFSLPAGRSTVLTLALNKLGRALLHAARGRLGATLTSVRVSPAPLSARSASVRLSAAPRAA